MVLFVSACGVLAHTLYELLVDNDSFGDDLVFNGDFEGVNACGIGGEVKSGGEVREVVDGLKAFAEEVKDF